MASPDAPAQPVEAAEPTAEESPPVPPPTAPEKPAEAGGEGEGGGNGAPDEKPTVEKVKSKKPSLGKRLNACCKDTWVGICTYVYNPKTHLCMGRNCSQWAQLLGFLICSYASIGMVFAGLLMIVLQFAPVDQPKYVHVPNSYFSSKIEGNPGLIFIPEADQITNEDSPLILLNSETKKIWGKTVDDHLQGYDRYLETHPDCLDSKCFHFDIKTMDENKCNLKNMYGYNEPSGRIQPVFLVRMSRIWGWKPKGFKSLEAIGKKFKHHSEKIHGPILEEKEFVEKAWTTMNSKNSNDTEGVFILCAGATSTDRDLLGKVEYCTSPFIPAHYFPFKSKGSYISPFVIIQVKYAAIGIPIKVDCYPFAQNIENDKSKVQGMDSFEFLID